MKKDLCVFSKTVHGYRHQLEDKPCQDHSSYYAEDDYEIICIADGHGAPYCHRSDKGSEFAVNSAIEFLKGYAKAIVEGTTAVPSDRLQRDSWMSHITSSIINEWLGAVHNDLQEFEVTEDDLKDAEEYEEEFRKGNNLEKMYGTTLIAGLRVKDYLILMQQGDGRCDVFYSDGTVDQPIPWDERCKGTATTSLCDSDAIYQIRYTIINLNERDVVACFVGSDGVEDHYHNNEESQRGTHRFYMELVCKRLELGKEGFIDYLDEYLPEFTKTGESKDDVSVAGIIDLDKVSELEEVYLQKIEEFDRSEKIQIEYENSKAKVISMSRKHEILNQNVANMKDSLEEAENQCREKETILEGLKEKVELYAKEIDQKENEIAEYNSQFQKFDDISEGTFSGYFLTKIKEFKDSTFREYLKMKKELSNLKNQMEDCESEIEKTEGELQNSNTYVEKIKKDLKAAIEEFSTYDDEFSRVNESMTKAKEELEELGLERLTE